MAKKCPINPAKFDSRVSTAGLGMVDTETIFDKSKEFGLNLQGAVGGLAYGSRLPNAIERTIFGTKNLSEFMAGFSIGKGNFDAMAGTIITHRTRMERRAKYDREGRIELVQEYRDDLEKGMRANQGALNVEWAGSLGETIISGMDKYIAKQKGGVAVGGTTEQVEVLTQGIKTGIGHYIPEKIIFYKSMSDFKKKAQSNTYRNYKPVGALPDRDIVIGNTTYTLKSFYSTNSKGEPRYIPVLVNKKTKEVGVPTWLDFKKASDFNDMLNGNLDPASVDIDNGRKVGKAKKPTKQLEGRDDIGTIEGGDTIFQSMIGQDANPLYLWRIVDPQGRDIVAKDIENDGTMFDDLMGTRGWFASLAGIPFTPASVNAQRRRLKRRMMRYYGKHDISNAIMRGTRWFISTGVRLAGLVKLTSYSLPMWAIMGAGPGAIALFMLGIMPLMLQGRTFQRRIDNMDHDLGGRGSLDKLQVELGLRRTVGGSGKGISFIEKMDSFAGSVMKHINLVRDQGMTAVGNVFNTGAQETLFGFFSTASLPEVMMGNKFSKMALATALKDFINYELEPSDRMADIQNRMRNNIEIRNAIISRALSIEDGLSGKSFFTAGGVSGAGTFGQLSNVLGNYGKIVTRSYVKMLFGGTMDTYLARQIEKGNKGYRDYGRHMLYNNRDFHFLWASVFKGLRYAYLYAKVMEQYEEPDDDEQKALWREWFTKPEDDMRDKMENFVEGIGVGGENTMQYLQAFLSTPRTRFVASMLDYAVNTSGVEEDPLFSTYEVLGEELGIEPKDIVFTSKIITGMNDLFGQVWIPFTRVIFKAVAKYNYGQGEDLSMRDALEESFVEFSQRYDKYLDQKLDNFYNAPTMTMSDGHLFNQYTGKQDNSYKDFAYDANFLAKLLDGQIEEILDGRSPQMALMSHTVQNYELWKSLNNMFTSFGADPNIVQSDVGAIIEKGIVDDPVVYDWVKDGKLSNIPDQYGKRYYENVTGDMGYHNFFGYRKEGSSQKSEKYDVNGRRISNFAQDEIDFFENRKKDWMGEEIAGNYEDLLTAIRLDSGTIDEDKKKAIDKQTYATELMGELVAQTEKNTEYANNPKMVVAKMMEQMVYDLTTKKYGMNFGTDIGTNAFNQAQDLAKKEVGKMFLPIAREVSPNIWSDMTMLLIHDRSPELQKYYSDRTADALVDVDEKGKPADYKLRGDVNIRGTTANMLLENYLFSMNEVMGNGDIDGAMFAQDLMTLTKANFKKIQGDWDSKAGDDGKGARVPKSDEAVDVINTVFLSSLLDVGDMMENEGYTQDQVSFTVAGGLMGNFDAMDKFMKSDRVPKDIKDDVLNKMYGFKIGLNELAEVIKGTDFMNNGGGYKNYNGKSWSNSYRSKYPGYNGYSNYNSNNIRARLETNRNSFANLNDWMDRNLDYTFNGYAQYTFNQSKSKYNDLQWKYLKARAKYGKISTRYPVNDFQRPIGGSFKGAQAKAKKFKPKKKKEFKTPKKTTRK